MFSLWKKTQWKAPKYFERKEDRSNFENAEIRHCGIWGNHLSFSVKITGSNHPWKCTYFWSLTLASQQTHDLSKKTFLSFIHKDGGNYHFLNLYKSECVANEASGN